MKDKRKHERYKAIARVMIRKANFRGTYYTRNVSAGGLYISTEDDLMALKKFKLTICLTITDPITVEARAVHHIPPYSNPMTCGYGIMFVGLSKDMRKQMHHTVSQILEEQEERIRRSEQPSSDFSLQSSK